MKKTWSNVEMTELNIKATNNNPTTELKADDIITGIGYKQGTSNGSGPEYEIDYYPENN